MIRCERSSHLNHFYIILGNILASMEETAVLCFKRKAVVCRWVLH